MKHYWVNSIMLGRSPPLYCTLTLIAMQGHQKKTVKTKQRQKAVRGMANWKAPGADSLPVTGRPHPRTRRPQAFPRHSRPCVERGGNPTGVEILNDQGAPQEVGPIRLQQLPRDFTRLPRRPSTAEDRRQSP